MDHETDLRRALENAEAECAGCGKKNKRLRKQLSTHEEAQSFSHSCETLADDSIAIANSSESRKESSSDVDLVTNLSAPEAKITLFRKLFGDETMFTLFTGKDETVDQAIHLPRCASQTKLSKLPIIRSANTFL